MRTIKLILSLCLFTYAISANSQNWHRMQSIIEPNSNSSSYYGQSVSMTNEFAVFGDQFSDRIYLFKISQDVWTLVDEVQYYDPANSERSFGFSVKIFDDQVFVGAPGYHKGLTEKCGAVYVFKIDNILNKLSLNTIITADDFAMDDAFGYRIDANSELLIVGALKATNEFGVRTGGVYVFANDGSGQWIQKNKITPPLGTIDEYFGWSISLDVNHIAVSSINHNDPNGLAIGGTVYLYTYDVITSQVNNTQILTPPILDIKQFGVSIMLKNDMLVIGAPRSFEYTFGNVFVYIANGFDTFKLNQTIIGDQNSGIIDGFGADLSFDSECLLIGARHENEKGSVYFYNLSGNIWSFSQKETYACYNQSGLGGFGEKVLLNDNGSFITESLASWEVDTDLPSNPIIHYYKKLPELIVNAGDDKSICKGSGVLLGGNPTASGGLPPYTYIWNSIPPSTIPPISNPNVIPLITTTYYLSVKDDNSGCIVGTDQVIITVDPNCPCQYPVYIDGYYNPTPTPIWDIYASCFSIACKPTDMGSIAIVGTLGSNTLTMSNGYSLTNPYPGINKQFISKLGNKGFTQWAHIIEQGEGLYNTTINFNRLHTDNQENTYLINEFWDKVTFENGFTLTGCTDPQNNCQSTYIVKFDVYGNIDWSVVLQKTLCYETAQSEDAIYLLGYTSNGFTLNSLSILPGSFLLKLDKATGSAVWCYQDSQNPIYNIAIRNSIPFVECSLYPNRIFNLDPATGLPLPGDGILKSQSQQNEASSLNYGGSDMFYENIYTGGSAGQKIFRSYKYEFASGRWQFIFKKIFDAPDKYYSDGFSVSDNYLYTRKANSFSPPNNFRKVDMLGSQPGWDKPIIGLSGFRPSTSSSLTYGYFIAADFNHNNDFVINQFSLQNGEIGCMMAKAYDATDDEENSKTSSNLVNANFELYPNPVTSNVFLKYKGKLEVTSINICLFSTIGNMLIERDLSVNSTTPASLDISSLPSGLYTIKVSYGDNRIESFKVIKQ